VAVQLADHSKLKCARGDPGKPQALKSAEALARAMISKSAALASLQGSHRLIPQ
jgi:hypothetical protein